MLFLFMITCVTSLLFMIFENPLSKGYMLLLLTISTSLSASTMHLNSWFGYILFLIMVGGMLVAFIYMTSIASNEKFKFPKILYMCILILMFLLLVLYVWSKEMYFSFKYQQIMESQEMMKTFYNMYMNKIFSSPISQVSIALMSYLFLALIMVVKMTDFIKGPIRQK
uniref:NADH-ubiquinone oxidoreductase chain 6 n=1 Tax=Xylosandrus germanus TaxID=429336 RepID=A0A343A4W0_XYLGE|nr:NADH dehydrogenase subunit 6 [Xylosandrus germanus]AOY39588.1 NADH dehydrogenase subunit 6 [Xylosandrus germanus]